MEAAPPNHPDAPKPTGMLVVDGHDLVRLGLRTLVQSHAASSGHEVQVFEARTLQEALALYRDQQAAIGLVLLDLHLPDAHGLAGQSNRQIADMAHLSEGTVKNHISTLLLLFGVRSRAQLISQLR